MVTFEVEDGKDRKFSTGCFVSIGLLKTAWIELLKVKKRLWCFREGFSLVALFLQGKEGIASFAVDGYSSSILLSE